MERARVLNPLLKGKKKKEERIETNQYLQILDKGEGKDRGERGSKIMSHDSSLGVDFNE